MRSGFSGPEQKWETNGRESSCRFRITLLAPSFRMMVTHRYCVGERINCALTAMLMLSDGTTDNVFCVVIAKRSKVSGRVAENLAAACACGREMVQQAPSVFFGNCTGKRLREGSGSGWRGKEWLAPQVFSPSSLVWFKICSHRTDQ